MTGKGLLLLLLLAGSCSLPLARDAGRPGWKSLRPGKEVRTFTGAHLAQIAFPLGGIGTGCVSLGGRGDLKDWEIFNRPGKGVDLPFSFFALWAGRQGGKPVARILERRLLPPYGGGFGLPRRQLSGVARMEEARFKGEFPFATVRFLDRDVPVRVELQAWNPMIPLDPKDSSIPCAVLAWKITNPGSEPVEISLAGSLFNPIGTDGIDLGGRRLGGNLNVYRDGGAFRGLALSSTRLKEQDPAYGTMALVTTWKDVGVQTHWYRGGWWDDAHLFWEDFARDGRLQPVKEASPSPPGRSDTGTLVLHARLGPGETKVLPFFLTWHFPNRINYWNREKEVRGKWVGNEYARRFKDAWDAARYLVKNLPRLEGETRAFHDAFFGSTLPGYVLDALSSQAAILKTNTVFRDASGGFFAFEGQGDHGGCCPLNCTHVWNYEAALSRLYPSLERSMRETDFLHNTLPCGHMSFRTLLPLGPWWWRHQAAADGQMGCVIRAYREWRFSGDTAWLRKIWPKVKAALEFAWKGPGKGCPEWVRAVDPPPWDADKDGLMEGVQHNTYDIEFYGPNPMTGSLYLGALEAASRMASAVGEKDKAREYADLYRKGRKKLEALLWNGEYYVQKVRVPPGVKVPENLLAPAGGDCGPECACNAPPGGKAPALQGGTGIPKYQFGTGCLSDQLLGQFLCFQAGLGYVLAPERVSKALHSIFKYNFRPRLGDFSNVQRVFALNDEGGLLLCSWPRGGRPALPFVYSDEVWTGIEYQVAASLVFAGRVEEGLRIVKAVRERYDGLHWNPWDEVECGHQYARALSSWALLEALTGFSWDGVKEEMRFGPRLEGQEFRTFWCSSTAWGTMTMIKKYGRLEVLHGTLRLRSLVLRPRCRCTGPIPARKGGRPLEVKTQRDRESHLVRVTFPKPLVLRRGEVLELGGY